MRVVSKATKNKSKKGKGTNNENDNDTQQGPIGSVCSTCEEICVDIPETDDETSIQCDFCNLWYHRPCTNVPPSIWNGLNKAKNIIFSCDSCVENKNKSKENFEAIKSLIENNQRENNKLIKNLKDELFSQVDKIVEEKLKQLRESNEKKQEYLSKMVNDVKATEINIEKNLKTQVKMYMDDKNEREDKRNNLVIHRLPETQSDVKDQQKKDQEDLTKIFEITCPEFKADFENIVKQEKTVIRLGNKKTDSVKPRPIKIIFPDVEMKKKIFKGCKNLKGTIYEKISIQSDLTPDQQEKNYKLRIELKERKAKGENVCIYKGQIINKTITTEKKDNNEQENNDDKEQEIKDKDQENNDNTDQEKNE